MRILIVDDHPMFRDAVHSAVRAALPDAAITEAGSIDAACDIIERHTDIDIVLLDLMLPGISGFDGLLLVRARFPRLPVLIVSGLDDARIAAEAIRLGAAGFVPKSASRTVIAEALDKVLEGSVYVPRHLAHAISATRGDAAHQDIAARIATLTPTQIRVLQFIRQGLLNKQIAHELGVGETTVKAHVTEILRKFGVTSRTRIVIKTAHLDFDAILKAKAPDER
jgi:DNA-binding NarL/FixJ family response regulator